MESGCLAKDAKDAKGFIAKDSTQRRKESGLMMLRSAPFFRSVRRLFNTRNRPIYGRSRGFLYPPLDRRSRIARQRIEAQLGLRRVLMHHIDQLLEQQEVVWV